MTLKGYNALIDELKNLKSVERPAIIQAIATAREHGDLSENAEYTSAREKQSFIEGRILELEDKTGRAEVIDPSKLSGDNIMFGATVTLYDVKGDEEVSYQIVGETESDIHKGLLSVTSPLGHALIGKKVDDYFELRTPNGLHEYEVVAVKYN